MTWNIKEFVNQNVAPAGTAPEYSETHVCILLALFNGADNLAEQLGSLSAQSHTDWSLIISDDGSRDDWFDIVADFSETQATSRTWLISGPRQGFAKNFFTLIKAAGPSVPYVAFCDQDDVWMRDKLSRALDQLKQVPKELPAVYCSRTMVCAEDLQMQRPSPLFQRPPSFANALVQNIGGGNTMVLNRAALDLVQDTLPHANGAISHDWWVYQLVMGAGGHVIYDPEPSLFYRQHGQNQIGANDTVWASAKRFKAMLQGQFRNWNTSNIQALEAAKHWLTSDAANTLQQFSKARKDNVIRRMIALRKSGVYRQSRRGTFALWLAALCNRL